MAKNSTLSQDNKSGSSSLQRLYDLGVYDKDPLTLTKEEKASTQQKISQNGAVTPVKAVAKGVKGITDAVKTTASEEYLNNQLDKFDNGTANVGTVLGVGANLGLNAVGKMFDGVAWTFDKLTQPGRVAYDWFKTSKANLETSYALNADKAQDAIKKATATNPNPNDLFLRGAQECLNINKANNNAIEQEANKFGGFVSKIDGSVVSPEDSAVILENYEKINDINNRVNALNNDYTSGKIDDISYMSSYDVLQNEYNGVYDLVKDFDYKQGADFYDAVKGTDVGDSMAKYLSSLDDGMLERVVDLTYSAISDFSNSAVEAMSVAKQIVTGKDGTATEIATKNKEFSDEIKAYALNGTEGFQKMSLEVVSSLLPQMIATVVSIGVTGGASTAIEVSNMTTALLGMQSGINDAFEMASQGYDIDEAVVHGLMVGGVSYATEKIGAETFTKIFMSDGGQWLLGAKLGEALINPTIDVKAVFQSAFVSGVNEGIEEIMESFGDSISNKVFNSVYGDRLDLSQVMDTSMGTPQDLAKQFLYAFAGAVLMTGGKAVQVEINTYSEYQNAIKAMEMAKNLYDVAPTPELKLMFGNINNDIAKAVGQFEEKGVLTDAVKEDIKNNSFDTNLSFEESLNMVAKACRYNIQNATQLDEKVQELDSVVDKALESRGIRASSDSSLDMKNIFLSLNKQQQANVIQASRLANELGLNVTFATNKSSAEIRANGSSGYAMINKRNSANYEIVLNAEEDNIQTQIISHEITHLLESSDEYQKLKNEIQSTNEYKEEFENVKKLYDKKLGKNIDIEAEAIAKYIEHNIATAKFVNTIGLYNENLLYKIFDDVKGMTSPIEKTRIENAFRKAFDVFDKKMFNNSNKIDYNNNEVNYKNLTEENNIDSLNDERSELSERSSYELRRIQEFGKRRLKERGWSKGNGEIDETLRAVLSDVFGKELGSRGYSNRHVNSPLNFKDQNEKYNLIKNVDGETFHDIFDVARTFLFRGELVDVHPIETNEDWTGYNDAVNYLSDDGLSGFSITKDGDLISVFNLSGKRGFLGAIANIVKENAKTLDCYVLGEGVSTTNLEQLYRNYFGFETIEKADYIDEYDHDGIGRRYNRPRIAFMYNPRFANEVLNTNKGNYGYHYGAEKLDFNKKSETLNERQERGTGAFDTGTYFFGSEQEKGRTKFNDGTKTLHKVDFSDYNLFKPENKEDGLALHDYFKKLDDLYDYDGPRSVDELENNINNLSDEINDLWNKGEIPSQDFLDTIRELIGEDDYREALDLSLNKNGSAYEVASERDVPLEDFAEEVNVGKFYSEILKRLNSYSDMKRHYNNAEGYEYIDSERANIERILGLDEGVLDDLFELNKFEARDDMEKAVPNADSIGTRIMKQLGYDGIDVRGIEGLDNSEYGSVIYDLNPSSVVDANDENTIDIRRSLPDNERKEGLKKNRDAIKKNGAYDFGMNAKREAKIAVSTEDGPTMRGTRTVANSPLVNNKTANEIKARTGLGEFAYTPETEKKLRKEAVKFVKENGLEGAKSYFLKTDKLSTAEKDIAIGAQLLEDMKDLGLTGTDDYLKVLRKGIDMTHKFGLDLHMVQLFKQQNPQGQVLQMQDEVKRIQSQLDERYGRGKYKLEFPDGMIERYLRAETDEDRVAIGVRIAREIAKQIPPTIIEQVNSYRHLSMLFNPRTWIKNALSNKVFGQVTTTNRALRSVIEKAFEASGKEFTREAGVYNPFSAEDRLSYQFFVKDYDVNFHNADTKYSAVDAGSILNKSEFGRLIAKNRDQFQIDFLNKISDFNAKMLSDRPAMSKAYAKSMVGYLKANNYVWNKMSEDKKQTARDFAYLEAQKDTFNTDSWLANKISEIANKNAFTKIAIDSFLPFKRTPINLIKTGVKYSPIGLIDSITRQAYDLQKGKITVNQFADNLASGLTGTSVALLGALLRHLGLFRTRDDDKNRKHYFDSDNGEQEYAIVTNGFSYTIDWLDPVIMPMAIGAEVMDMLDDGRLASISSAVDLLGSVVDPMFETSMLSGLAKNLSSHEEGGKWYGNIVTDMVTTYLGQYVPTVFGAVARTVDDTRRTTKTDKGNLVRFGKTMLNKIPFASKVNQPYINRNGEEGKNEDLGLGAFGRGFLNFVSPGYYSSNKVDEYDEELYRLYDSTGLIDAFPSNTSDETTYDKVTYKITPEEQTTWNKTRWSTEKKLVDEFIDSDLYKNLTDEEKVEYISELRKYSGEVTKKEFLSEKGVDYTSGTLTNVTAVIEQGMSPVYYFAYKNSGDKQADKYEFLENSDLTDEQKAFIWNLSGYKKTYSEYSSGYSGNSSGKKKTNAKATTAKNTNSQTTNVAKVQSQSVASNNSVKINDYKPTSYAYAYRNAMSKNTSDSSSRKVCPRCGNTVYAYNGKCPICGQTL